MEKEPIAYIINEKDFWKHTFYVEKGVLIPRPETELFLETLLKEFDQQGCYKICEIGCGSGALSISLALEFQNSQIFAIDISQKAIEVTRTNLKKHNIFNLHLLQADELSAVINSFDIIISNPPYISHHFLKELPKDVIDHEPLLALDGGADGLELLRKFMRSSLKNQNKNLTVLFEFSPEQKEEIERLLLLERNITFNFIKDYSDRYRMVKIKKTNQ